MTSIRPNRRTSAALALTLVAVATTALFLVGPAVGKKKKGPKGTKVVTAEKSFTISGQDTQARYEVYCPRGTRPLGGGAYASPVVDGRGVGAYPGSEERLGQQDGWHVTMTLIGTSQPRNVTLQTFCSNYKGDVKPIEKVLGFRVEPGQVKEIVARCPGKRKILTGGYLSTHLFTEKGVYVSESRADGNKGWKITAVGVPGGKGGEVNPIAYCFKSKKPLIREVASAPTAFAPGSTTTTAVAPVCGGKKHGLVVGGYSGPSDVKFFDTYKNPAGAWSVSGFGPTGAGPITSYAYCLR
jgi:hypothetical protein